MADRIAWLRALFAQSASDISVPPAPPEITLDEREERYRRGMAMHEFLSEAARLQLAIDGDILSAASERRMR